MPELITSYPFCSVNREAQKQLKKIYLNLKN